MNGSKLGRIWRLNRINAEKLVAWLLALTAEHRELSSLFSGDQNGKEIQKRGDTCMHFQFSSVAQSCPILCDPMNHSTPGLPVHHQLPEFTQTHVHRLSDAIQPSHPWSSPSPPAPNPSQRQSLFQWVGSSHQVAKVLGLQQQSFQWIFRTDLL